MVMKGLKRLIGFGFALTFFYFYIIQISVDEERGQSGWEKPVFTDNRWVMKGVVDHGVEIHRTPWGQIALIQVRYGQGTIWAMAGVTNLDGDFSSRINGIEGLADLLGAFQHPRWITLSIPGDETGWVSNSCQDANASMCKVILSVESGALNLLPKKETVSGSNLFQWSGFQEHTPAGILTWPIELGEIIEQGLEGF
jgi:hypothetical protein